VAEEVLFFYDRSLERLPPEQIKVRTISMKVGLMIKYLSLTLDGLWKFRTFRDPNPEGEQADQRSRWPAVQTFTVRASQYSMLLCMSSSRGSCMKPRFGKRRHAAAPKYAGETFSLASRGRNTEEDAAADL